MLHTGSRGVGNRMGKHFIHLAREDMHTGLSICRMLILRHSRGDAVVPRLHRGCGLGAGVAPLNRDLMMRTRGAVSSSAWATISVEGKAVNCHHNYVAWESHFGENVLITRKGAVSAREGDIGIIPGSMGTRRSSCAARAIGSAFAVALTGRAAQ